MVITGTTKQYKKALVLGTGGGNDIVSAIVVALQLQKQGIQTDIAGILSPAVIHYFEGKPESIINKIIGEVKRYIPSKQAKEISFLDGKLPEIIKNTGIHIENFYDFSIRYGTQKLTQGVNDLIQKNAYDLFVTVDVGGDILARGSRDTTLLSPLMDFASLQLLKNIPIDSLLVEFGLGTDGELRAEGMREIIDERKQKGLLLVQSTLSESNYEIQKFKNIYNEISKIRRGHTGTITLETLKHIGEEKDFVTPYRFISQIGNVKVSHEFDVTIPHESLGKIYSLKGKEFAQQREKTAISFENNLEQYIILKTMQSNWKTELDLFYLRSGENRTSTKYDGKCLHLLAPSKMINESKRKILIEEGIIMLSKGETDMSVILKEDKDILDLNNISVCDAGIFSVLYIDEKISDDVKQTVQKITQYQKNISV